MLKCERNQKHQTSLNDYAERSYILCKDNAIFCKTTILLLSKTIKNHRISITKQNFNIIKRNNVTNKKPESVINYK